jgi:hypothetical protein
MSDQTVPTQPSGSDEREIDAHFSILNAGLNLASFDSECPCCQSNKVIVAELMKNVIPDCREMVISMAIMKAYAIDQNIELEEALARFNLPTEDK